MVEKQTVFFPGKFQPPHMGHILTIARLKKNYKVVIGITEGEPRVVEQKKVKEIFQEIFGKSIDIVLLHGTLTDWVGTLGLPEFDILVSGNEEVIVWANKKNLRSKFINRSEDIPGCSGTEIRNMEKWRGLIGIGKKPK